MAVINIEVKARSGKPISTIEIDSSASVADFKKKFHAKNKKFYPARQRFTLPTKEGQKSGEALKDTAKLADYNLSTGSVLYFKDLGTQIDYSTVFFFEYLGPLLIYPLFFFFPQYLYYGHEIPQDHALVQKLACGYWMGHYAKRILETFLVHKFGHDTMPIRNLFKNCSYYYGFAAFVAYFVNHPSYTAPNETQSLVCLALALLCQASNLWCHIILANLRKPGEKGYKIPKGFLFNYITCANYSTEIWGWTLFTIATQTLAAGLFTFAGAYQMAIWAQGKHKRLLKIFNGKDGMPKYPKRWIMLPPFF